MAVSDNRYPVWPGWETVRLIGRGSFGAVYEIQRTVYGEVERAALKVISLPQNESDVEELYVSGYDEQSVTAAFQAHLKSIINEYTLMRKMNGSANVVNCDDFSVVDHANGIGWDILIKMELLTPLFKVLPVQPTEEQVVAVGRDICRALALCRKYNIIHRDIKPQNIFVSSNGDYKLGDFGIAKTVEKTSGGTKIGTYKYMAPEVYNNKPYGPGADIYSLGLVLYWLLNERRMPFMPAPPAPVTASAEEEARLRRFRGEPLPPPLHGSQRLKTIVLKACAYRPEDRYRSAADMLADLEALQPGKTVTPDAFAGPGKREAAPAVIPEESTSLLRDTEEKTALLREEEEHTSVLRDEERTTVISDSSAAALPVSHPPARKHSPILFALIGAAALLLIIFAVRGMSRGSDGDAKKPQGTSAPAAASATAAPRPTVTPTPTPRPTATPEPLRSARVELDIQDSLTVVVAGDPERGNQVQTLSVLNKPGAGTPTEYYSYHFEYDESDRLARIDRYAQNKKYWLESWDLRYSGGQLQSVLVTLANGTKREQTAAVNPTLYSVVDEDFGVYTTPDGSSIPATLNLWIRQPAISSISDDGSFELKLEGIFGTYASLRFENGRMALCEFKTEIDLDDPTYSRITRDEQYDGSLNYIGAREFFYGDIRRAVYYDANGNVTKDYSFDKNGNLINGP